uniref:Arginine vasopressin-induced protein 1 n=1 Tax=Lates calcarifer TaxID=8187 RepID=A0A4W6C4Z1_LATCA
MKPSAEYRIQSAAARRILSNMSTSPPSRIVAGPSSRLAERRSRKAGSGNIFSNVNLWQLQRLFRAAGDQDAEQRAQLIWGHGDETELAQALIGLRARSHRRGFTHCVTGYVRSMLYNTTNGSKCNDSSVSCHKM